MIHTVPLRHLVIMQNINISGKKKDVKTHTFAHQCVSPRILRWLRAQIIDDRIISDRFNSFSTRRQTSRHQTTCDVGAQTFCAQLLRQFARCCWLQCSRGKTSFCSCYPFLIGKHRHSNITAVYYTVRKHSRGWKEEARSHYSRRYFNVPLSSLCLLSPGMHPALLTVPMLLPACTIALVSAHAVQLLPDGPVGAALLR